MIAEYLNRDVVLDQLREIREDLESQVERAHAGGGIAKPEDVQLLEDLLTTEAREVATSSGQLAYDPPVADRRGEQAAPLDDYSFFSREPIISLLQSALDQYSTTEHPEDIATTPPVDVDPREPGHEVVVSDLSLKRMPPPRRTDDGRRVFDKFSITDVRWVRSLLAEGIRRFRGKRPFNTKPAKPCKMPERVRIVAVGDWATGLPRARKVAVEMRKVLEDGIASGLAQHVVHLGDTYYSGWEDEYLRRFLPFWPVKESEAGLIGSWSTNGNHDMYSGGQGYFDLLLKDDRFHRHEQSSFFSLVNKHWKILGLDTAWEDAALCDPQASWLEDEIRNESRQVLFLSHHQPFSAYEGATGKLVEKVAPILEKSPIKGWFWGHEHRCMLYGKFMNVEYGRCIGHGGVPVYMWHGEGDPYPPPGVYEYRKYIQKGLERWALFGFAVLDFDGPSLNVTYIDEDGLPHEEETLASRL